MEEQFKKYVEDMEQLSTDSKIKASFLEEQNTELHNRLKGMSKCF